MYVNVSVKKYASTDFKSLTYAVGSDQNVTVGSLVIVPFRNATSLGVVVETNVPKPSDNVSIKPLERVLALPALPSSLLQLAHWLAGYYVASPAAVWQTVLPSGLARLARPLRRATPKLDTQPPPPITLTPEQTAAITAITAQPGTKFLLDGVTGSGKTEVYAQVARQCLERGQSVLILVPEISLTPQTVAYFESRMKVPVTVTHSKLTAAARRRIWLEIGVDPTPRVVIGPRSALFLPFHNLGLIVVDEEHEASYKQHSTPRYNATVVAAELANLTGATLVYGSATPSLQSQWLTEQGRLHVLRLPTRLEHGSLPRIRLITLCQGDELLSKELLTAIAETLGMRKQVLLFLNQRGSAQAQICSLCGFVNHCRRCDNTLTFHASLGKLVCHICGLRTTPPSVCPQCEQTEGLLFVGAGTERVETEVKQHFPEARVARLDRDSAKIDDIFTIYEQMRNREIDILVGTQMVARGLDLEHIRLVGVVLADTMLYVPDYAAAERTFQLITQVIGRAGRRDDQGLALIQTYLPNHPAITAAIKHDNATFYRAEMPIRQAHNYPPFRYLLKIGTARKRSDTALQATIKTANQIRVRYPQVSVLGPAQPLISRTPKGYWWQLIIKGSSRQQLQAIAAELDNRWTIDLDPITIV